MANNAPPLKAQVATNPGAFPPGSMYGLPGITRYSEQIENNDGNTTALQAGAQVDAAFVSVFKQTDIAECWSLAFTWTTAITQNAAVITSSPYFPYGIVGPTTLNFQNQFNTINVTNGIDLAWRQVLRPRYYSNPWLFAELNPQSSAYSAETNYSTASNYTFGSATIKFALDMPGGIWFDVFYVLAPDGSLYEPNPLRAFVSPQYMAGSQRIIQPRVRYNQVFSTTRADQAPLTYTAGPPSTTGTVAINFQREVIYQPAGDADSPLLFNWQYTYESTQFPINGRTSVDIPVAYQGQILSVTVRLFDPSSGAVGAPIDPLTAITNCQLLFGSGLYKYQDRPYEMQRRFVRQHGFLPFQGFICWDMAMDKFGRMSNQYCLNTLDTAGITVHLDFTGAQSATAYAVVLVEGLKYIQMQ